MSCATAHREARPPCPCGVSCPCAFWGRTAWSLTPTADPVGTQLPPPAWYQVFLFLSVLFPCSCCEPLPGPWLGAGQPPLPPKHSAHLAFRALEISEGVSLVLMVHCTPACRMRPTVCCVPAFQRGLGADVLGGVIGVPGKRSLHCAFVQAPIIVVASPSGASAHTLLTAAPGLSQGLPGGGWSYLF